MITLKTVLRMNATSCIIFAIIFLLMSTEVASFLGQNKAAPELLLLVLGLILLTNGLHILWVSWQLKPNKYLVLYFAVGDFIWVVASIILVSQGMWITTTLGIFISLLVAMMVGTFGVLQIMKNKI
ncbi:hypothetical protein [uncultured Paraglaciecola sp.]|uniref:hypothetical protein n=1 Tax=uncultured Paraglaciecola sp. TaxID=1765024 RepID=UPI0025E0E672|nr:hypothetical protein [uncultured Paraglaciecola sp.]